MTFKIVERNIGLDARNVIDKDVKNKWVWNWLLEKDLNNDYLSDYVRKIDHGSSGKKYLKLHAIQNKEKHLKNKEIFLKNTPG